MKMRVGIEHEGEGKGIVRAMVKVRTEVLRLVRGKGHWRWSI